jgi:hypothetical protein
MQEKNMEISEISDIISKIGVPAAGAVGIGYLFYLVLQWMMKVIITKLDSIESMVVKLIDRIRMMDNDLIRIDSMIRIMNNLPPDYDRLTRKDGSLREVPGDDNRRD